MKRHMSLRRDGEKRRNNESNVQVPCDDRALLFELFLLTLIYKYYTILLKDMDLAYHFFRQIFQLFLGLVAGVFAVMGTLSSSGPTISPPSQVQHQSVTVLFSQDVGPTSTGEDVVLLQILLSQDPAVYPQRIVSGYYGELTKQAVQQLQNANGIPKSGIVDYETRKLIDSIYGAYDRNYYLSLISNTQTQGVSPPDHATYYDMKPWGQAWKQEDGSYTMRIEPDPTMSTPRELADAINAYRQTKGVAPLAWSDTLAAYAQTRAVFLSDNGSDNHAGFNRYLQDEDGFNKLGFYCLGENFSEGFRLNGTHLVEWMYAQSPGHDANQVNAQYKSVGIGIHDVVSVVIFGGCN